MFRHRGKHRNYIHNLRLSILLSFVAGTVNITGVLALKTLTTNVTGHFAYFAEEISEQNFSNAITFFVFTIFFLLGSFSSNFITEIYSKKIPNLGHVIPIAIEIVLLCLVGFFGKPDDLSTFEGKWIAYTLLFSMGIQNSLVTKISQSTVRTTHLTGLFTDLGIELSQLFFYKNPEEIKKLKTTIYLKLFIITFFFIGCVVGGFVFHFLMIRTLLIGAFFLLIALLFDYLRFQYFMLKRKKFKQKSAT
jgi:uncharacterized membrane protein YoaK (UPF0700 family)